MKTIWMLTALTFSTRFYNLSVPDHVCWDETHFGKMATHYLNHTYFMDVHPPLGKMLIALAGFATGYDGNFGFIKPGDKYISEENNITHYYGMRAFSAITGSLVVPLTHGIVKTLTSSNEAALLTSVLMIFDPGFITLSQYILLDPILIFFMAASAYFTVKYSSLSKNENDFNQEFSFEWWKYIFLSGTCLGCMISVKWIGLFTVGFIGSWTVFELWSLLGDVKGVSIMSFVKHFLARVVCLIILPLSVYVVSFAVHYELLDQSGSGDGAHSSMFQSCLKGNELYNASMPLHVAYDSIITLKHHHSSIGGYLHSHRDTYPVEVMPFQHQQVTLYYHKDNNNYWEIMKPSENELQMAAVKLSSQIQKQESQENKVEYLHDGAIVRLRHFLTQHHLHSHPRSAPMTPRQQIVSGQVYSSDESKLNELWKIEIVNNQKDNKEDSTDRVQILSTVVRFVHINTGCLLHTTLKTLPHWGSKQGEVTCSHHRKDRDSARWNVDHNTHDLLEKIQLEFCQMTFLEKFVESHLVMATSNSGLKPAEGERTSKAWHWPLNYKGQHFSGGGEDDLRVYLLGNPVIFWLNLFTLILFPFMATLIRALELRGFTPITECATSQTLKNESLAENYNKTKNTIPLPQKDIVARISRTNYACKWFYFGWALHYLPFYLMSRVLYFHHYYPAFIFSCCLTGSFLDLLFKSTSALVGRSNGFFTSRRINLILTYIFIISILQSFYLFSPLCYGMTGPLSFQKESNMHGLKLLKHWDI